MNNLTVTRHNGINVVDSREVAEMVDKRHDNLLRDIDSYSKILTNSDLRTSDFFHLNSYQDSKGEWRPRYLLTRKGCDMVANKMTGEKGVLFTAKYVTEFEKMENELSQPKSIEDLIILQAQSVKNLKNQVAHQAQQIVTVTERVNNLDLINIDRDLKQRLNSMICKVARDRGIPYSQAWREFTQNYNIAYHTNLTSLRRNFEEKQGKSYTTPGYLNEVGKLEDAIRVADKMLNKER